MPSPTPSALPLRLALALALSLLAVPSAAHAQAGTPADWVEIQLGSFVLLGPAEMEPELALLATRHGQEINLAYAQLSAIYQQSLPLPINIRLYPDAVQLARLNAIVPPLGIDGYHTHIGSREIALVQPVPPDFFHSPATANILRHELNGLFLSQLSAGLIPAGLETGINQYVETPGPRTELAIERLRVASEPGSAASFLPWRDLLDGTEVHSDASVAYPQSLAMVAFLVDSYGFDSLIELVQSLGQGHSYRAALAAVYGRPVDQLERDWHAYLPQYLESRWQHNALNNYDLGPFEAGLDAGAYSQVATALEEIIPFLTRTGQAAAVAQAEFLHTTALRGMSAAELAAAEQQAIRRGDYAGAITLAEQAQAVYAELGDSNRVHQLADHLTHLRKIVELRESLAGAQALADAGQTAEAESQFLALAEEFRTLGDAEGRRLALAGIDGLYAGQARAASRRQNISRMLLVGAGVLAGIIFVHQAIALGLSRRREPGIL